MEKKYLYGIDDALIESYKARQTIIDVNQLKDRSFESLSERFDSTAHFWLNDDPGEYPLHWHPRQEMIVPLENIYTITIEHKSYELSPGDIFMIPSGKLHRLHAPDTGIRLILIFDINVLSGFSGFSNLVPWLAGPILINRETCPPIYDEEAELISQLVRDYQSTDGLREIMVYNKLLAFFINYARYQTSLNRSVYVSPAPTKKVLKNHITAFNAVLDYMDNHYTEELSLEKVANVAGFSKFHFSRLFKELTNYNFYDYLMYKRIKLSEALLAQPDLHITEIALQCGFTSLSTFNRTFKKVKGCTPSECRKLINA